MNPFSLWIKSIELTQTWFKASFDMAQSVVGTGLGGAGTLQPARSQHQLPGHASHADILNEASNRALATRNLDPKVEVTDIPQAPPGLEIKNGSSAR
ncbi:hypothetical protein [Parvularcula lutaonensis]|uniref:Uncharacterized protein n=1 Tax=Parvularcula lutaonensis TaxID=491923 RepID=A0ABV7M871_9PROT|nr:hypothetical protein [Parvularcula lutaonensis]GGY43529.1 hypothetical protein GCM10007148_10390 [Parvularcula lutaonensis]